MAGSRRSYQIFYYLPVHQRFASEEIHLQISSVSGICNQEIQSLFSHLIAHQSPAAMVLSFLSKTIAVSYTHLLGCIRTYFISSIFSVSSWPVSYTHLIYSSFIPTQLNTVAQSLSRPYLSSSSPIRSMLFPAFITTTLSKPCLLYTSVPDPGTAFPGKSPLRETRQAHGTRFPSLS